MTSDVARAAGPAVPTAPASPSAAAPRLAAVIPALDEASSIGLVLSDLAGTGAVERVVVCDNGSTDATADIASRAGAWVVRESRRGYGAACLRALAALEADPPDIVLFLDADRSDDPGDLSALLAPLREGTADLVIGSRARGRAESGSMTPAQRFGNWLASRLLRAFYGVPATDLGPFRAIRWDALRSLGMRDQDFGWTIEMQVKAARRGLRVREVPVRYRKRIGRSKISGTVRGTVLAGAKILGVVAADLARHGPPRRLDPASRRGIGL